MEISITTTGGALEVRSPYSKAFTSFGHERGGKWSDGKKAWLFDPRDEFAVRSAMCDIYGTDDYESAEKIDLRLHLDKMNCYRTQRLWAVGREIANRRYSDYRVDLGDDVVVIAGGFPRTSPERRSVVLGPEDGTILEVRSVPVGILRKAAESLGEALEVLGRMDTEKLKAEREHLLKRVEEIDRLIEMAGDELATPEEGEIIADLQDDDDGPPADSGGEAEQG